MNTPRAVCTTCRQGPRPENPLYYLRGREQFIAVCDACVRRLAARTEEHAPDGLFAAWERLVDKLLRELQWHESFRETVRDSMPEPGQEIWKQLWTRSWKRPVNAGFTGGLHLAQLATNGGPHMRFVPDAASKPPVIQQDDIHLLTTLYKAGAMTTPMLVACDQRRPTVVYDRLHRMPGHGYLAKVANDARHHAFDPN